MKREEVIQAGGNLEYDDLSVVFNKVNTQYSGKLKMLVNNYTSDGYIYIIISNSSSQSQRTLLACNKTDILATCQFTHQRNDYWLQHLATSAIGKTICFVDSTSAYGYKLRRFIFNDTNNIISEVSTINSGNSYADANSCCYYDSDNYRHYSITMNSNRNTPCDYNIDTGAYTNTNNYGGDAITCVIDNSFTQAFKKLCLRCNYANGNTTYFMATLPENRNFGSGNYFTTISNQITYSHYFTQWVIHRRYNNPWINRIYVNNGGYKELLHNDTYTSISLDTNTFTSTRYFTLYVNDACTKFWRYDSNNDLYLDSI
ncbi:MAG: hypothetical protein J5644_03730 [Bacteroidales bacterium]|nr:hypothetical protein [Bacteroidales bacterium]